MVAIPPNRGTRAAIGEEARARACYERNYYVHVKNRDPEN